MSTASANRPAFVEFDTMPPPLRLLRSFRPRSGVEQRQFDDPLRRLPHHLEGDVAAHREPGERETRRRRCQNTGAMAVIYRLAYDRRPSPDRTATMPGFARRKGVPSSSARERERSASCQSQSSILSARSARLVGKVKESV